MIVRIVKLKFQYKHISTFKTIFENSKQTILSQKGCRKLELLQDSNDDCTFFTYSYWDTEEDLNTYRNSEWFKTVWASTKVLFQEKPMAWSTRKLDELK